MMPLIGLMSLKSRPQPIVKCSVPRYMLFVGSKSTHPNSGTYTENHAWEASPPTVSIRASADFLDMDAGDGRNQALFNYILTLTANDFTVDETHNYCLSGGIKVSNSKSIGSLESSALAGHDAFDFITQDAKLIRGQANSDFWRSIRTG